MARQYTVNLDTLYLTDTGLSSGRPCKLTVSGIHEARVTYSGASFTALDGTPHIVAQNTGGKGQPIAIQVAFLPKARLDDLIALFNSKIAASSSITLGVASDIYTASFAVLPQLPAPITGGIEFSGGIVKNVSINLIRAGV